MCIPPERLQRPFIVSSILFGGTYVPLHILERVLIGIYFRLIGLLAWGVGNAHGTGPLFSQPSRPAHDNIAWAMMFGITSVLGGW